MKAGVQFFPLFILIAISSITACTSDKPKVEDEGPAEHAEHRHDGMDSDHDVEYETAEHINTNNLSNNAVPADVLNNFQNKYVNVPNVEWSENDSGYTANFKNGGKDFQAHYNKEGEWEQSTSSVKYNELPDKLKSSFAHNQLHKDSLVYIQMTEASDGNMNYHMEFRQDAKKQKLGNRKLIMNEQGLIQNKND